MKAIHTHVNQTANLPKGYRFKLTPVPRSSNQIRVTLQRWTLWHWVNVDFEETYGPFFFDPKPWPTLAERVTKAKETLYKNEGERCALLSERERFLRGEDE